MAAVTKALTNGYGKGNDAAKNEAEAARIVAAAMAIATPPAPATAPADDLDADLAAFAAEIEQALKPDVFGPKVAELDAYLTALPRAGEYLAVANAILKKQKPNLGKLTWRKVAFVLAVHAASIAENNSERLPDGRLCGDAPRARIIAFAQSDHGIEGVGTIEKPHVKCALLLLSQLRLTQKIAEKGFKQAERWALLNCPILLSKCPITP